MTNVFFTYQLRLFLKVYYLGEEVRDLLLLSGGVFSLSRQLFSQRGHLYVGITWEQSTGVQQQRESARKAASLTLESEDIILITTVT